MSRVADIQHELSQHYIGGSGFPLASASFNALRTLIGSLEEQLLLWADDKESAAEWIQVQWRFPQAWSFTLFARAMSGGNCSTESMIDELEGKSIVQTARLIAQLIQFLHAREIAAVRKEAA